MFHGFFLNIYYGHGCFYSRYEYLSLLFLNTAKHKVAESGVPQGPILGLIYYFYYISIKEL